MLNYLDLGVVQVPRINDSEYIFEIDSFNEINILHILKSKLQISVQIFAIPRKELTWDKYILYYVENSIHMGYNYEIISNIDSPSEIKIYINNEIAHVKCVEEDGCLLKFFIYSTSNEYDEALDIVNFLANNTTLNRGKDPLPAYSALNFVLNDQIKNLVSSSSRIKNDSQIYFDNHQYIESNNGHALNNFIELSIS